MPDLQTILEELHTSEINAGVQSFWHNDWTAWIGDPLNGRKSEMSFTSIRDIGPWLEAEARRLYPQSDFALLTAN